MTTSESGKTNTYFFLSPSSNTEEDVFRELLLRQAGRPCIFHKNMWIIYVIKSVGGNGHVMLFCIKLCWPCAPDIWGTGTCWPLKLTGKYQIIDLVHQDMSRGKINCWTCHIWLWPRNADACSTISHFCTNVHGTWTHCIRLQKSVPWKKCAFGREKRWTYVETSWKCELMPMHFHRFGWVSKVTCDMDDIWMWMFHRHLSRIQIFNWVCS